MNPLTCPEVEERIELFAADECDEPIRLAIESHLTDCPTCARSLQESQQLIALLNLNERQFDALERLQERLAEEARPRRRPRMVTRIWQPLRALAALLLVTFGLSWWLAANLRPELDTPEPLALVQADNREIRKGDPERFPKEMIAVGKAAESLSFTLDLGGRTVAAFQEQVRSGTKAADLPKPPEVNLPLEIRNQSDHPLRVWLGGRYSTLTMNLRGPGVVRVPAGDGALKPFGDAQSIPLAPGKSHFLPISRLVSGSNSEVYYLYWTKPGRYVLTVELRTLVCRGEKNRERCSWQTIVSPSMALEVRKKKPVP
jgi:hypothetical protein